MNAALLKCLALITVCLVVCSALLLARTVQTAHQAPRYVASYHAAFVAAAPLKIHAVERAASAPMSRIMSVR